MDATELGSLDRAVLRARRSEKWSLYPEDVLPAWVAEMDYPLAPAIRDVLEHALAHDDLGYPMHPAPTPLPGVFARRMAERFDWSPDPRRVELLTDVVQGIHVVLHQMTQPGDGVVVQTPIYPPFLGALRETGRRLVENPFAPGATRMEMDAEGLRRGVDAGTRVVLLCNPHNPTGRVLTRGELEAVAAVALEHDLVVVADEIHADLVFPGHSHVAFASLSAEVEARTVTLTSATKAFNIPGLRCAVAAFGSEALHRRFNGLSRNLRGGLGLLGIEATIAAWTDCDDWLQHVLAYLDDNRRFLRAFVDAELPGVQFHEPEASYLAWLDCRELGLEPSPYHHFLERARVALANGPAFGTPGEGFVRLNFATSRDLLSQILERMAKSLR